MTPKHIHIVGCLPRSGTTLMTELMINCFKIDGYTDHEHSIFKEYPKSYQVLCTKKPNDIKRVDYPLDVNKNLYVIYVLRDPRDTISSRSHKNNRQDKKIWGNLHDWMVHQNIADKLDSNPRFITVRYEDLVADPDQAQLELQRRLPFLTIKTLFSDYHNVAKPSKKSEDALGGARKITTASIGKWRNNMPYIKAQIDKYGDISQSLITLGYEQDAQWMDELATVVADNSEEPIKKKSWQKLFWEKWFTLPRRQILYRISCSQSLGPALAKLRHYLRNL